VRRFEERGLPALLAGDFQNAVPSLLEAQELEGAQHPTLARVNDFVGGVQAAIASLETTAASFERVGAEPALNALLELGSLLGMEPERRALRDVSSVRKSDNVKAWNKALSELDAWFNAYAKGKQKSSLEELSERLLELPGTLTGELAADLLRANQAGDPSDLWLQEARRLPLRWLVREYFRLGRLE
jgi:hypothetical protein